MDQQVRIAVVAVEILAARHAESLTQAVLMARDVLKCVQQTYDCNCPYCKENVGPNMN